MAGSTTSPTDVSFPIPGPNQENGVGPELAAWKQSVAKLDWYDSSFNGSLDTCGAGAFGVLLAAAAFPTLAFALTMILNFRLWPMQLSAEALVALLFYGIMATVCACAAGIFALFVALIIVPAANATCGCPLRADTQIKSTGALVGFLCVGWTILIPLREGWIQSNSMRNLMGAMVTCLLLTFLAMAIGHYGAITSARRLAALDKWKRNEGLRTRHRNSQFQLVHMFSLTAWVAAVFALQQMSGYNVAVAVGVFFLFAMILEGIARIWKKWRGRVTHVV